MQFQDINLGIKGKFQVTVKNADGTVKTELPWQDNLITDTGLKMLNGADYTSHLGKKLSHWYIHTNCMIGSSSIEPANTDTRLGEVVAVNSRAENYRENLEEPTEARPHYLRQYWNQKYIFTGLNNVNITELGLGKWENNSTKEYALFTHALIKDEHGRPTTVTVLQGEILEINYEMSTYWDLRPKKGEFTLTKVKGTQREEETFEYLAHLGVINNTQAPAGIYIKGNYNYVHSYGVNSEVDTDLTTPYNFSKWNFPTVNTSSNDLINAELKKFASFSGRISHAYYNTVFKNWTYEAAYAALETENISNTVREHTWCFSPYTFNHENGIRALQIPVGSMANTSLNKAWYTVVFTKKGSSHGLMKTDIDILKLSFRTEVTRYEGTP